MRFGQPRRHMCLTPETLLKRGILRHMRCQHLQRYFPFVLRVVRPEYLAHAALAERAQQPVAAKGRSVHANPLGRRAHV